ncbi:MAG: hypothetical protein WCE54_05635 [Ignavibacteriaceae bacterium]
MEKIIQKYSSFEEAENAEIEYWRNASVEERIKTLLSMQELMLSLYYPEVNGIEIVMRKRNLNDEGQD